MSDDGLMGRAELERAFAALGARLVHRGVVADLFIVDGAAMALAYDADRVTRCRKRSGQRRWTVTKQPRHGR